MPKRQKSDRTPEELALRRAERAERNRQLGLESRLGLPFYKRLPIATLSSFLVGAGLGMANGTTTSGLRFRAENAHRLPTSPTGWFLYHKSKNYNMALGGVREGLRMGTRVAFWTAAFFGIEDVFDRWTGRRDFGNTIAASLGVAGGVSLWNRFPVTTAARTAKGALAVGLVFGLAQDAVAALKGRRPAYVDFISRRGRRKGEGTPIPQPE